MTSISGKVGEEIWRATLVAFGLSVTIEGLQVFSPVRTASLVDVTTNTLGALAGALMVPLLIVEVRRAKGTRLYVGVPTVHAWLAAALGAGVALAAELTHWLLGLSIRWEAAATHALALGLGAWAAHRRLAPLTQALRGSARARAAIFAYGSLLVLWGWRPLLPETDVTAIGAQLTPARLIPLQSLAERVDVFSALHVAQQFLLYVPLGSMLAVWPLRLAGRCSHLRPALWVAVVIELGHLVIVDRYLDVTNALVACAGLGIGWIVLRRSGFAPYGAALAGNR